MEKFFNNAGPSVAADHYIIDPLQRIDIENIELLIKQKRYFILHAPRQTGKTTSLLALMNHLNQQGTYQALYSNIETAQTARNDVKAGMNAVVYAIAQDADVWLKDSRFSDWAENSMKKDYSNALRYLLSTWTKNSDKPTVLFLDEVDALVGDTLISLLRQIRAGYAQRPHAFPQAIILCGIRDVRDYRIHTAHKEIITGGSAFNIKAKSLRLGNLSEPEVNNLWQQHTEATGQGFDPTIFPQLWQDTRGQPWLVNALGYELTWENKRLQDRSVLITLEDYWQARESLIQSRTTHLDQLTDKLKEKRVHSVISALLASENKAISQMPFDDLQYVEDLGLIRRFPMVEIANRIYRETIPRELTYTTQYMLAYQQAWYLTPQRCIDMPKLLAAFQQFFRENADAWIERFDYKEAGPQLLLQAFLQRIINGGGRISREYGLGRKRTDLLIEWPVNKTDGFHGEVQRIVLELKVLYQSLDKTISKGLQQTAGYADQCAADEAHLLIFNRRKNILWDDKIWQREETYQQRKVGVWGL